MLTHQPDTPSEFQFFNGPLLTVPFLRKVIDLYIPDPADRTSELATPQHISVAHAKKQPPTLIINSSADPLRDGGKLFGEKLQETGIDCTIATMHGQLHDSVVIEPTRNGPTPRTVVQLIALKIRNAVGDVQEKRKSDESTVLVEENTPPAKKRRKTRSSN